MATISVTIPDSKATIVRDAVCAKFEYKDKILAADGATQIPNPVSKPQFVELQIKEFLKNCVIETKNRNAIATVSAEDNNL